MEMNSNSFPHLIQLSSTNHLLFAVLAPYTQNIGQGQKLFVEENCIKCGNELQLIPTLDTIVLYKSAATWLQALEGVVDQPTEHVSLVLLHLDQFLQ